MGFANDPVLKVDVLYPLTEGAAIRIGGPAPTIAGTPTNPTDVMTKGASDAAIAAAVAAQAAGTVRRGTGTVATGATTAAVTFTALASANFIPIITPTSSWGSATKIWAATKTTTGFTVTVDIAPGGAGLTFEYGAILP